MDWAGYILRATPEIALFAALALGHALGRLKLRSFNLGGVAGSLIVGLVIGQLTGVELPDALKAVCFALFIYSVGFKSGPEFFGGLNQALSFPMKVVTVVMTDKRIAGETLRQLRDRFSEEDIEGVYVLSLKRQGLSIPLMPRTQVWRGDVFELAGRPEGVDRGVSILGYAESPSGKSDLAYHALGIVLGTLIGLISITVGGIPVTLGVGGGVLVSGLCFGWLHTRYPVFGALPQPAQWVLSEFGLSAFAAAIGLSAGPKAAAAIQQQGISLLVAGAAVTVIPVVVALYFGRFVLKLHPVVLLGAICGGQTVAAALSAANEETDSTTPVLGFTVTYAISNVLLAVWGPVIVAFT